MEAVVRPSPEDSSHSFPVPAWGPSQGRQSSTNSASVGTDLREQLYQQTCSSLGSSLHHVKVLPAVCSSIFPTGPQPPLGIQLHGLGFSTGCRDNSCLTMVCITGCRGISVPGAAPASPSALTCRATPFSGCNGCCAVTSFPFSVCNPRGVITMAEGFSLGQCQCSIGSQAGVGSVTHGEAPSCFPWTPPLQPLAAKALPCRAHALCLPGTAAWSELQPSVPLHQSRDLLQGWAAQPGPAETCTRFIGTALQSGLNPSSQQL